jgi:mono/diheme cytochrome c family protein
MTRMPTSGPRSPHRAAALATTAIVLVAAACGGASGPAPETLSAEAREGQRLYASRGCAGCHGGDGGGGIGPALAGIAGTERELIDGTTVVADREYLERSITHPNEDIVAGYRVRMPENNLDDGQVSALVAYILELESDE